MPKNVSVRLKHVVGEKRVRRGALKNGQWELKMGGGLGAYHPFSVLPSIASFSSHYLF